MTKLDRMAMVLALVGAWLLLGGGDWLRPAEPPPINSPGLNVFIVEETGTRTPEQQNIIQSQIWRDYVRSVGGDYKVFDPHQSVEKLDPKWHEAKARPRGELPWVIVSSEKGGVEQSLPVTLEEFMAILKRYGE